ncbi:MAG: DUF4097 domain-containing protein [Terriglobia bacterium]
MRVRSLLVVGLVAVGVPLAAQNPAYVKRGKIERQGRAWVERIECGASVRPGARLRVRADRGSVRVKPGPDNRMECEVRVRAYAANEGEAKRYFSRYELSVRLLEGAGAYLRGRLRHPPTPTPLTIEFEIKVPRRFNLDLQTGGGDLIVERLEGELRAVTAGGDIRTGDVTGPVRAETAGGSIVLGNIGQRVEARTAGGAIRVGNVNGDATLETSGGKIHTGRIAGAVRAKTAGGDILLAGAGADIIAQTAGGQIRIGESGGGVRAQTAGGSINLDAVRGPIRVETAGGSIHLYRVQSAVQAATAAGKILAQIAASAENFGASLLETSFGDVEVYLPPDLPLTIDATIQMATGHKILTDFPLTIEGGKASFGPSTLRGHGALNGGGVVLRILTTAGNIEIRKLDASRLKRLPQRQERQPQP